MVLLRVLEDGLFYSIVVIYLLRLLLIRPVALKNYSFGTRVKISLLPSFATCKLIKEDDRKELKIFCLVSTAIFILLAAFVVIGFIQRSSSNA